MSTADTHGGRWRRVIASALVFHEAVAERLGINATDLKCLELAAGETEPVTPTRLAELAGVTTGAITGVLDRLERAGIVTRTPDSNDRRSVVVRVNPERAAEIAALYAPLLGSEAWSGLLATWDAGKPSALDAFLDQAQSALEEETSRLRAAARGGMIGDTFVAPLAGATRGRLHFTSGAPRLTVNAAALGQQMRAVMETSASRLSFGGETAADELIRAQFDGPPPEVRTADGTVTIRYRRRALDLRNRAAAISVNAAIPWSIEVDGGITDLEADLRAVRFAGLDVRGGANHLRLQLPRPDGTVRVRVDGGVSDANFQRPATTAAELRVRGGVSHLRFDDQRLYSTSGELRLKSTDFAGAAERYEIEITGGASQLSVTKG